MFIVCLPLLLNIPLAEQGDAVTPISWLGDLGPDRSGTVLLAHPSSEWRAAAARELRQSGRAVVEAGDGVAALAVIRSHPVSFLVAHERLALIGGAELCAAARAPCAAARVWSGHAILIDDDGTTGPLGCADDRMIQREGLSALAARIDTGARILTLRRRLEQGHEARMPPGAEDASWSSRASGQAPARAALEAHLRESAPTGRRQDLFSTGPGDGDPAVMTGLMSLGAGRVVLVSIDGRGSAARATAAGLAACLVLSQAAETPPGGGQPGSAPMDILRRIFDEAAPHPAPRMAASPETPGTAIAVALINRFNGVARIALAGHPPPALIEPDGRVTLLGSDGSDQIVGLPMQPRSMECQIAPGEALLFLDRLPGTDRATDRTVAMPAVDAEAALAGQLARAAYRPSDGIAQGLRLPDGASAVVAYSRPPAMPVEARPASGAPSTAASETENSWAIRS